MTTTVLTQARRPARTLAIGITGFAIALALATDPAVLAQAEDIEMRICGGDKDLMSWIKEDIRDQGEGIRRRPDRA